MTRSWRLSTYVRDHWRRYSAEAMPIEVQAIMADYGVIK